MATSFGTTAAWASTSRGGSEDGFGVTANDSGDSDGGPNGLQNYPVLGSASSDAFTTSIAGTLNSTPSSTFYLDFYSNSAGDPSGYGEGEAYLGADTVTTDGSGNVAFASLLSTPVPVGDSVTRNGKRAPRGAPPNSPESSRSSSRPPIWR